MGLFSQGFRCAPPRAIFGPSLREGNARKVAHQEGRIRGRLNRWLCSFPIEFPGEWAYSKYANEFVRLLFAVSLPAGGEMSGLRAHFLFGANSLAKNRRSFRGFRLHNRVGTSPIERW